MNPMPEETYAVLTGPHHQGRVTLEDGTEYDITPQVVAVESAEHQQELVNTLSTGEYLPAHLQEPTE